MTIFSTENLSVLLQGPAPDEFNLGYAADHLRNIFPGCEVIRTTSDNNSSALDNENAFDHFVRHADPGPLPTLKFPDGRHNNANRQFQSVQMGLKAATREYVLRLRTDQMTMSSKMLNIWTEIENTGAERPYAVGRGRILTSSLFSLNPRFDERMPYHVSDMLQFGFKDDVKRYFTPPSMPLDVATYYERNPHSNDSTSRERLFRSQFGVEQWLCMHYLSPDKLPLRYHNDCRPNAIELFEQRMVDNFIIVHPRDLDLRVPRFDHASRSLYYNATCYSTKDWLDLFKSLRGGDPLLHYHRTYPENMTQKLKIVKSANSDFILKLWRKTPHRLRRLVTR